MNRSHSCHWAVLAALAGCVLLAPATAQISLPPKPQAKGNVAPYLVCSVCGERNYTAVHDGRHDKDGNPIAWCNTCKRDTSQRSVGAEAEAKKKNKDSNGGLRLPPSQGDSTDAPASAPAVTPATSA